MSDIAHWLEALDLGKYAGAFEENRISLDMLHDLDHDILKDVGVAAAGDRIAILRAIRQSPNQEVPTDPSSGRADRAASVEAERRQLSVMFCDLVGSTALSERLDPEELHSVMQRYRKACSDVIERYNGFVAQYLGDGVMVYFGWPRAHEDDAQRAVQAGLDIVEAVASVESEADLAVRVGIATGLVVVGDQGDDETGDANLAVGETPNMAARVQALAEANSVAIAQSTRRLLGGVFELSELGEHTLKGISGRTILHRVVGERRADSRFAVTRGSGLTPLVGRETEISMLLDRWDQAKDGEGQVVLLEGEAGIGKSRVTEVLRERLAEEPHVRLRYQGSPYYTNSAFYPIIAHLERAASFEREDDADTRLDKLQSIVVNEVAWPLIAAMVSLPLERYPPLNLEPIKQKEETIAALVGEIETLASEKPLLMVFEDAHWYDPTTLETLDAIIERLGGVAALAVITYRPEFEPPWSGFGHLTNISLNRLSRRQGAELVAKVTDGKAFPDEVLDQIVAKTDGVPLFVEELTKTVLEAGFLEERENEYTLAGPLPPLAIPATLQDSLMARLDRLSPVKEVAQIGACIGREFSYELLAAVSPLRDNELQDSLVQLTNSELIFRRGNPPDATYSFKHAFVQDTAYESLLKSKRQQLHTTIAKTLEERFPDTVEAEPELVAQHYASAGLYQKAIPFLVAAGERDVARFANSEAIHHLETGLDLLNGLPAGSEKDRMEIPLQTGLGMALMTAKGFSAPEAQAAFSRGRALCEEVGESPYQFPIMFGLFGYYAFRAEWARTEYPGEQCVELAIKDKDESGEMLGLFILSTTSLFCGRFEEGIRRAESAIVMFDPDKHRDLGRVYGIHPGPSSIDWQAWGHWMMGYPDAYLREDERALALTREIGHPLTSAMVIVHAALWDSIRDDAPRALTHAQETIGLCKEAGIPLRRIEAEIIEGWARAEQGDTAGGIDELEQAMSDWRDMGCEIARPWWLALVAKARLRTEEPEKAIAALQEALNIIEVSGERAWEAELNRLMGAAFLAEDAGAGEAAEAQFRKAITVAGQQKAKSLELRAATSLAGLWQSQGKAQEARALLAPVYDWFSEGFDTADLVEAKILLENL